MKRYYIINYILFCLVVELSVAQDSIQLSYDFSEHGIGISPTLYGIFFEDINYAADGGLYAELIRNRSFEESASYWQFIPENGSRGDMAIETSDLLNEWQTHCLKISADSIAPSGSIGIRNLGFWGINVVEKNEYKLTFYAKASEGYSGVIKVALISSDGTTEYASQRVGRLSAEWKKYNCSLVANDSDPGAMFALTLNAAGTVWLDVISLFPPTFFNRSNGLRNDLAQKLVNLQPKFMRFPGGCFVEGADMARGAFHWKETIGAIEERPGHPNYWGYQTTDGLGFHEFLQLSEDLGAEPLYVCNAGMSHGGSESLEQLNPWVQDVLDAIEYANGDTTTPWGNKRKINGHAAPYNMKYIEIGNEDWYEPYTSHYNMFYDSIKAYYPEIITISNVPWSSLNHIEVIDDHYYRSPEWFAQNSTIYDNTSRSGPKIYVGEYAVALVSGAGRGNLRDAVGEACFMTGLEKNSDQVIMGSYAPLFGNINQCQWHPNAIYYNGATSYTTPSYYVQQMFASNTGNRYVPVSDSLNTASGTSYAGAIGVATWLTRSQYDSITVKSGDSVIISENFEAGAGNWSVNGGAWIVNNGVYEQTSLNTDCRSTTGNITMPAYSYHLKARKVSGDEGFLVIFGYTDENNYYWWNIGGWANTLSAIEHSIDGSKSTLISTPLVVSANRWYDIRIDIDGSIIKCYLDNTLIHSLAQEIKNLYSSCTVDSSNGDVFLKVVNFSNVEQLADIHFKNLTSNTFLEGEVQTMTYPTPFSENSITLPEKIVPVTNEFSSSNDGFEFAFMQNSVNVFHLYPQSTIIECGSNEFSVPENTTAGSIVGTITATGGADLRYSVLESSVMGAFEVIDSTGEIVVNESKLLNFEFNPTINLTLIVSDATTDTIPPARSTCIINLLDINEKPELAGSNYFAFVTDNPGASIGRIFCNDEDKDQEYTYTIKSVSVPDILGINSSTGELLIRTHELNSLISQTLAFSVEVSDNGVPALSDDKEFTLEILGAPVLVSVENDKNKESIHVYPNPASDYITVISTDQLSNAEIVMYDIRGRKVYKGILSSRSLLIPIVGLGDGLYYLQVISNGICIKTIKLDILKTKSGGE